MSESVILCEGYHDGAFWAGWLLHLGCTDLSLKPGMPGRFQVLYPWGRKVSRGQYAYQTTGGRFLRVFPCGGKDKVLIEAKARLTDRGVEPLLRLVVNVDPDTNVAGGGTASGLDVKTSSTGFAASSTPLRWLMPKGKLSWTKARPEWPWFAGRRMTRPVLACLISKRWND